jgi:hypothetical protein
MFKIFQWKIGYTHACTYALFIFNVISVSFNIFAHSHFITAFFIKLSSYCCSLKNQTNEGLRALGPGCVEDVAVQPTQAS